MGRTTLYDLQHVGKTTAVGGARVLQHYGEQTLLLYELHEHYGGRTQLPYEHYNIPHNLYDLPGFYLHSEQRIV